MEAQPVVLDYVSHLHLSVPPILILMTAIICLSFVLCVFMGYSSCNEDSEYGTTLIGHDCERDYHCIEHAFCRVQRTCLCDPYYSPSPEKSMCIATAGLSCKDSSECQTMANAECKQDVCACKDNAFLDMNNSSNCINRPVIIGDICQVNEVCQESFDRALCIDGRCSCIRGHHFTNQTKSCIPSKGLHYHCEKDYECYLDDESPDVLECKNYECFCKEGEPRCAKGSLITVAGTLVTISLFLQRIV